MRDLTDICSLGVYIPAISMGGQIALHIGVTRPSSTRINRTQDYARIQGSLLSQGGLLFSLLYTDTLWLSLVLRGALGGHKASQKSERGKWCCQCWIGGGAWRTWEPRLPRIDHALILPWEVDSSCRGTQDKQNANPFNPGEYGKVSPIRGGVGSCQLATQL